jgi:hypothetical protein
MSMQNLMNALADGPQTVKDLAAELGLSDSRIRELLKKVEGVQTAKAGSAPATFWLDQAPEPSHPMPDLNGDTCPLCGSSAEQVVAGEEGSFLGACRTCPDCGETYNAITGKALPDNPAAKPKRKPLNPQYKIELKTKALEDTGGKLSFDKASRQWIVTKGNGDIYRLSAKEFSKLTPETVVTYEG